jgi:kinesin family protein 13
MYLRNRFDEPLDSYQTSDLERLRHKWSDALINRREFLDAEVRKMMDKREQSVSDLEKQNELLDQWAMLQWQRAAVLQPKGGSGVPGAPNNWSVSVVIDYLTRTGNTHMRLQLDFPRHILVAMSC